MAQLTLATITKSFGDTQIIKGVDLDIKDGEFVVFVGPSGCGKSTLLRLIAGLEECTSGQISIGGNDVTHVSPSDRGIAMVFQTYALYPHMTVEQNLSFGLENTRMPKAEIQQRVLEAAKMLQIEQYLARKPRSLSGGQRQRVAIGRAIVRQPSVFLFDEPLSNLDAALRVDTRSEIINLHKRLQSTIVYVTHDQIEAMTMADRIAILNAGIVEQFDKPLEVFSHPRNRFVAGFIGSPKMNFYRGTIAALAGNLATLAIAAFPKIVVPVNTELAQVGMAIELGIRPSHLRLEAQANNDTVPFRVDYAELIGTETYMYGHIEENGSKTTFHLADNISVNENDLLHLALPTQRLHLFRISDGLSLAAR
ncbi:sn-glycerol-3-phosphate ABC transporter ATP-binding protein UgpC [Acerihabitans sp. TG2]|uniref:ABC transporter ATP-binding protein n=1 Tax=Acerihabitans sp. TG2 TaxID=3096008 RepID=UPI002B237877|nr:sn-glycerol-3-phosphate ABC transporter ATP-binding protein UgpC [Acerihabitans sp. TG2]MEA9389723.1 sn-glycerol-3-phosphate ABC transporter ATP-binding protein UgpC [Acerihabitans sp. TG2]